MASCSSKFECSEWKDWVVITEERPEQSPVLKQKWRWYQGRMNRHVAEDVLCTSGRLDGTFLVRESDSVSVRREPVFVISVMDKGQVHHLPVMQREDGKYTLADVRGAKAFKTMEKMINHYQGKPVDLEGGGSTKLKYFMEN